MYDLVRAKEIEVSAIQELYGLRTTLHYVSEWTDCVVTVVSMLNWYPCCILCFVCLLM